ncbi:GA2L3 protein, partial [Psilopogon haemacephalus]|nr:GA2L3 protein [Psilopogon haemacephalus]
GTSKKAEPPALKSTASAPASKSSSSAGTRAALVRSETLRKRIRSPDAPKEKLALPQGSPAPAPHLAPPKNQPSDLAGTAETRAPKQKPAPAKCQPVSATKAKGNPLTPRTAQLPVTNLRAAARLAHSQQLLAKPPSESAVQTSGAVSRRPQKASQTAAYPARTLKSASVLKHSASAPSLALSRASKSPPALVPASKNLSPAVSKQPKGSRVPQAGPTSPRPPERTPLSVVRLPQSSAKAPATKKPAQPSAKAQPPTKTLPANASLAPAAKKPLPKGKSATACNKGMPEASNGPLVKSRQDDHYFVMTGSKKPRK